MIRLLLYRVLPLGAAAAIFTGALSPLRPALSAFGAAANALAGDTNVQSPGFTAPELPDVRGAFSGLGGEKGPQSKARLQALASDLRSDPDDPYGQKPGARGLKPIRPPEDAAPPPAKTPRARTPRRELRGSRLRLLRRRCGRRRGLLR